MHVSTAYFMRERETLLATKCEMFRITLKHVLWRILYIWHRSNKSSRIIPSLVLRRLWGSIAVAITLIKLYLYGHDVNRKTNTPNASVNTKTHC